MALAVVGAAYPPTRNGRAPFIPIGVNSCPALVLATADSPQRIEWCRNTAGDLNASAIDTGTKYMASGYVVSADGAQISLYSGGVPSTHGGGGGPGQEGYINIHSGIKRHVLRMDGVVGLAAGYLGAHAPPAQWAQMLTVPLQMPDATLCASGDIELQANILSGVGGGAHFQLEQPASGAPIPNHTLSESLLLRGNWIRGQVAWGDTTDDPDHGRHAVLTPWSKQRLQIRVALRDAELFSLSVGCTQQPHYTQCRGRDNNCSNWGVHYQTIPCGSDAYCRTFGTCANVLSRCVESSSAGGVSEHVCVVTNGTEPGPVCGWF